MNARSSGKARVGFTGYLVAALSILAVTASGWSCGGARESGIQITLKQYDNLEDLAAELPLPPDSIAARYELFDSATFRSRYADKLDAVRSLIDSLGEGLPDSLKIDTLSIDHSFANLGEAARARKTIFISSSYFVIFDDWRVLRSVIYHEFGHVRYAALASASRTEIDSIWSYLQHSSLLYLVRDGEYSGNARFGGHPNESPTEMFASTFNLMYGHLEELQARLQYVDPRHLNVIHRLLDIVRSAVP